MTIDPKVVFWTWAWINMAVAVALVGVGVRHIQHGDVARHRRLVRIASGLVVFFVVAYAGKLAFLGREDLASWQPFFVHVLRFHELCVLGMLVGGGWAFWMARRGAFIDTPIGDLDPVARKRHRMAGRIAGLSGLLGVLSAGVVLFGMYQRAGVL